MFIAIVTVEEWTNIMPNFDIVNQAIIWEKLEATLSAAFFTLI